MLLVQSSKLLRQDIQKYRSLFLHVSAAIQLRKYPVKGDTIQYIYTNSKHSDPLCRLDAADSILGFFGFDRTTYSNLKRGRRKWERYEVKYEVKEHRERDIETKIYDKT